MKKYKNIVIKLIRVQEPKGRLPFTVEEMILGCRKLHEMGSSEAWKKVGVDKALWRQITSMPESEVDKLFHWLGDNKSKLKEVLASGLGVDPKRINLRD